MSAKTDLIKRVAAKVASKAKKPVAPAAKQAINQKMKAPLTFKASGRKNAYGEYPVSAYNKGSLVKGADGEAMRGYETSKVAAQSTAKAESRFATTRHQKKMGTARKKK